MSLDVRIDHRVGDFRLAAEFTCAGRLTALFGPSGSGKTSIVNAIAGLLRPDAGRIVIGGETLTDTQAGVFLPPHRRHVGYVFQEARLFPHLTVRQNLLYAQWFGGRRASPGAGFEAVVAMLGVGHLLRRYPSHLSGGEKQRVAIGRALLSHPRLLLMDEPLASLDAARKQEIMPYIERLRDEANVPIVYVSHAFDEVRRLADLVVVLDNGRVAASGPPQETLATFVNHDGTDENTLLIDVLGCETGGDGMMTLRTRAGVLRAARADRAISHVALDTDRIILAPRDPGPTSALNTLPGVVQSVSGGGAGLVHVRVRVGETEIVVKAQAAFLRENALVEGSKIYLLVTDVRLL